MSTTLTGKLLKWLGSTSKLGLRRNLRTLTKGAQCKKGIRQKKDPRHTTWMLPFCKWNRIASSRCNSLVPLASARCVARSFCLARRSWQAEKGGTETHTISPGL